MARYRARSLTLFSAVTLVVLALPSQKTESRSESLRLYGLVQGPNIPARWSRRGGPSRGFRAGRDLFVAPQVFDLVPITETGIEPACRMRLVVSP